MQSQAAHFMSTQATHGVICMVGTGGNKRASEYPQRTEDPELSLTKYSLRRKVAYQNRSGGITEVSGPSSPAKAQVCAGSQPNRSGAECRRSLCRLVEENRPVRSSQQTATYLMPLLRCRFRLQLATHDGIIEAASKSRHYLARPRHGLKFLRGDLDAGAAPAWALPRTSVRRAGDRFLPAHRGQSALPRPLQERCS